MRYNQENKNQSAAIEESVKMYQKNLMDDMNLTLRLSYLHNTHVTKPIEWVERLLIFEAPISKLDWVIYPQDAIIDMVFVSKLALFHSQIRIVRSYRKGNSLFYVGEVVSPIVKKQQREYFRLDVTFDVKFQLLPTEENEEIDFLELPYEKGICVNISTGGMCLNTNLQLKSSQNIMLEFYFVNMEFNLKGKILGLGEMNSVGYYSHRVQFQNLDIADTNLLTRLIFEKQRSLLKKTN